MSNNQLAQLDLHDLDLNDLNLAMGAFVALLLVVVVVFCFPPGDLVKGLFLRSRPMMV